MKFRLFYLGLLESGSKKRRRDAYLSSIYSGFGFKYNNEVEDPAYFFLHMRRQQNTFLSWRQKELRSWLDPRFFLLRLLEEKVSGFRTPDSWKIWHDKIVLIHLEFCLGLKEILFI